ncbi:hypothetical protein [Roseomonas xinghualingensis]|uniref:hypothetical protein n=1 Tax=Roseomonas xinghualingensis TaxID=2986475 RepID=UPI0021F177EF|nr:hypothetical protein [Roseomonas sp. SXEYE001]MCV4209251.1 hypothetical protein [Roseomonas sp. SXEYE001]
MIPRPPLSIAWDAPDKSFWILGESPEPNLDPTGQIVSATAVATMGARHEIFRSGGISLTTSPQFRAETAWQEKGGNGPKAGAVIYNELAVPLSRGFRLETRAGFGNRIGVFLPRPDGAASALAFRGEASLSGSLGDIGQEQTRFDLRVAATHLLSGDIRETEAPSTCELNLQLSRKGLAPLNIGASCPGAEGERRITFGIMGRF